METKIVKLEDAIKISDKKVVTLEKEVQSLKEEKDQLQELVNILNKNS